MATVSYHAEKFTHSIPLGNRNAWIVWEAINDSGHAVGTTTEQPKRAVLWNGTSVEWIDPPGAVTSGATDINNHGQVVGRFTDAAGATFGFFRDGAGQFTTLRGPGGDTRNEGLNPRLNDLGVVVASCRPANWVGVRWAPLTDSAGDPEELGVASSMADDVLTASFADDINDFGVVAGSVTHVTPFGDSAAFHNAGVWTTIPGLERTTWFPITIRIARSSGVLGGSLMVAPGDRRTFRYDSGNLELLFGPWPGDLSVEFVSAHGGILTGSSRTQMDFPPTTPFIYQVKKGLTNLNSLIAPNLGWELQLVTAVSDSGAYFVILGKDGIFYETFLVTRQVTADDVDPPPPPTPPVPHEWVSHVLGGFAGESGIAIGPDGRPIRVPPRGPADLSPGMTEVLQTLAAHELTRYSADPATRRTLQPSLLRAAANRLERMAEAAAQAPPAERDKKRPRRKIDSESP